MAQAEITKDEIDAVYPTVAATVADALGCDPEDVKLDVSLIEDLDAESIDFLDIVFRLERAFKVKIPRGKIVEDARGDLSEADFEQKGIVTDAGMERLRSFLSEVPADRIKAPLKVGRDPAPVHRRDVLQAGGSFPESRRLTRRQREAPHARWTSASARFLSSIALPTSRRACPRAGPIAFPRAYRRFPRRSSPRPSVSLRPGPAWRSSIFGAGPVAGLARETRFLRAVRAGDTLALEADLESCTDDDVAYAGRASLAGESVIVLEQCLGPMLPTEDFDAPEALRRDFETLCADGAPSDRFAGVAPIALEVVESTPAVRVKAMLQVPDSAPFFADHFPRKPVFPATLLLDSQIRLALGLAREAMTVADDAELAATRVLDVKIRAFIAPGQRLEISAEKAAADDDALFSEALRARERQGGGHRARRDCRAETGMSSARRRVAVTGLGLVTPAGNDVATTWDALLAGRSGVAPITLFDASGFSTRIAAEVKGFDPRAVIDDRKLLKYANRSHAFALAAADAGDARRRHSPDAAERRALGHRGRHRHDGRRLPHPRCGTRAFGGERGNGRGAPADRRGRARPDGVLPQPVDGGRIDARPALRHPRLRDLRAYRLRLGRPGDRYRTEVDPPRRRRSCAGRRVRLDGLPGRPGRVLPARRGIAGQ